MTTIDFTACQHLRFENEFRAKKKSIKVRDQVKITWQLRSGAMCQFCKLRGRINSSVGCLTLETAYCSNYAEKLFSVPCGVDTE